MPNTLGRSFPDRISAKLWNGTDLGRLEVEKAIRKGGWGRIIQSHGRVKGATGKF